LSAIKHSTTVNHINDRINHTQFGNIVDIKQQQTITVCPQCSLSRIRLHNIHRQSPNTDDAPQSTDIALYKRAKLLKTSVTRHQFPLLYMCSSTTLKIDLVNHAL